jgi:Fe-S cluster assembly protein SufD
MNTAVQHYLDEFKRSDLEQPLWLKKIREKAITQFASLGFPKITDEEWRFTPVESITKTTFLSPPPKTNGLKSEELDRLTFGPITSYRLVAVNGQFDPSLSAPPASHEGILLGRLRDQWDRFPDKIKDHLAQLASYQNNPFVALNTAFLTDAFFVLISKGTRLLKPIHIVHLSRDEMPIVTHPRVLILLEEGSEATIIERFIGSDEYFTNAVTEIVLEENAGLDYDQFLKESSKACHVGTVQVHQAAHARFSSQVFTLGGHLVRQDLNTILAGEGANSSLEGLYLTQGDQIVDNHTSITHASPHTSSLELYKGILGGTSKAVFKGRIEIEPKAQKTTARQTNRNLILSDDASINTTPLLEIHADDVKCNHGATIGRLDEESLFYLRSRGIEKGEAKRILTRAFASEVIQSVKITPLKIWLDHFVLDSI